MTALNLNVAWDALSMLPPQSKVDLITKHLNLDADLDVVITPDDGTGEVFKFEYYGKSTKAKLRSIVNDPDKFSEVITARILDAKLDSEQLEVIFEEPTGSTQLEDRKQALLELVAKADNEDTLAEIFDYDWQAFKQFYDSPARRTLDGETRSFLLDIIKNPYPVIWSDDIE